MIHVTVCWNMRFKPSVPVEKRTAEEFFILRRLRCFSNKF